MTEESANVAATVSAPAATEATTAPPAIAEAPPQATPAAPPLPIYATVTVLTATPNEPPVATVVPFNATDARKAASGQPGRMQPRTTLEDVMLASRGGTSFMERGGRGGGRGRSNQQQQQQQQATISQQQFPSLPPAAADGRITHTSNNLSNNVAHISQPQPVAQQQPQQQGVKSFASVLGGATLAPLVPVPTVPAAVLAAVGIAPNTILPQLPKFDAHRYEVAVPFVTRASKNFDHVDMYMNEEFGFRHLAMRRACRVVIVRTAMVMDAPFIFLYDISHVEPAAMLSSRVTLVTLASRNDVAIEGLEAPKPDVDEGDQLYVLQGPMAQLRKWADRVVVRAVIGGRTDEERLYDAVGIPRPGWDEHLLGAPLSLVQEYKHAPRKATVKPTFDRNASLYTRFKDAGTYAQAYKNHLTGVYLSGYNIRIIIKAAFTVEYKKYFANCDGVASVYTDVKTLPTPIRVSEDQPTQNEMDIAAHEVGPSEMAMHGGLVTTCTPPPDLFNKIAAALKVRVIRQNAVMCVFGVPKGRVAELENRTFSGWVRLASERHG